MTSSSFAYSGTELDALTEAKNYYRCILSHFAPYVGKRVLEVGAGIGTFSEFLLKGTNAAELILLEPAVNLFPLLHQRFSHDPKVKLICAYLENISQTTQLRADSLVVVNVLEHIENPEAFLKAASHVLVPGGTILLFVPALPRIYGTLDEAFGHVQRYTKSLLASQLREAKFRIVCLRYFNLPGVITWLLVGRVLKQRILRSADVRFYDRWVVPWVSRLERRWEPPFGQSIIAIASK